MSTDLDKDSAVADYLRGTCISLEQGISAVHGDDAVGLENDIEFCSILDDKVFCCEGCGWWCGMDEIATDNVSGFICDECGDPEDE